MTEVRQRYLGGKGSKLEEKAVAAFDKLGIWRRVKHGQAVHMEVIRGRAAKITQIEGRLSLTRKQYNSYQLFCNFQRIDFRARTMAALIRLLAPPHPVQRCLYRRSAETRRRQGADRFLSGH